MLLTLGLSTLLAAPPCRSAAPAPARTVGDLDRDRREDTLEVGDGVAVITLSGSGRQVEASSFNLGEDEKYGFVSALPVPSELVGTSPRVVAARRAVEDALFATVCDAPDPSLAWLLDDQHRLNWLPDPFEMPTMYTVYSTEPRHLAQAKALSGEGFAARGVWFTYRGHNHDRSPKFGLLGKPRVLAERGDLALLGTAHGVVLADRAQRRHAWLYILSGGVKLRFTTVAAARFDQDRVVVELELAQVGALGRAWVDLATGKVTSKFWHTDDDDVPDGGFTSP